MSWKRLFKIFIFIAFALGVFLWLKSDFWLVKKVDCLANGQGCETKIWNELAESSFKKNIIFFPHQQITNQILKNYLEIEEVKIKKRLPQTVIFQLSLRKPVAVLAVELPINWEASPSGEIKKPEFSLTGSFYLIDKDGVVLEKGSRTQILPLILMENDPGFTIGQRVGEENLSKSVEILLALKLRLLEPKVIKPGSQKEVEVWLKDDLYLVLSLKKEIDSQLDSLQLIYLRAKIEGKGIKKIDLRFDKPVIVE